MKSMILSSNFNWETDSRRTFTTSDTCMGWIQYEPEPGIAISPDFIWVSLGAPKQEEFSSLLVKHINHGLIVSVGAAFDFYSNLSKVKRAPIYIQTLRLEWLYRLYKQPKKTFKRLKNEFFYMPIILIKELIKEK